MKEYKDQYQSKDNRKQIREFLNEVYLLFKGEGNKFIEKFEYNVDSDMYLDKEVYYVPEAFFNSRSENLFFVNEVKNKIRNSVHANNELLEDFNPECILQVGQKLDGISDLLKFTNENQQTTSIKMEEGKSTIIYFWSVHSLLTSKHLKYLNETFDKNSRNWEAHLRVVLVNIDCYRDKIKAFDLYKQLKLFKLTNVFYLPFDENQTHPLIISVIKYGYPMTVVVNSDLVINMIGSFFEASLEKIVEESKNRKIVPTQSTFHGDGLKEDEKATLKNIIKELPKRLELFQQNDNYMVAPHLLKINFVVKRIFIAGKFNIPNPRYNPNSHQYLPTPSSDSNFKTRKNHPQKQKNAKQPLNANSNLTTISVPENSGGSQLKPVSKHGTQSYNISDKPIYTPKSYFIELDYICHANDEETVSELFKGLNSIPSVIIRRNHVPTSELNFGSQCFNCSRSLVLEGVKDSRLNNQHSLDSYRGSQNDELLEIPSNNHPKFDEYFSDNKHHNLIIIKSSGTQNIEERIVRNSNNHSRLDEYYHENQYYCPICSVHFCLNCANSITDIISNPDKLHKHFMILLTNNRKYFSKYVLEHNVTNTYSNDFKYFQFNHFLKDSKYNQVHHQTKCDACKVVPFKSTRWKCCNCVFKNLCDPCFQLGNSISVLPKDKDLANEVKTVMRGVGCDAERHVFMKIVFDGCFY